MSAIKELLKSKTFWTGVATVATGAAMCAGGAETEGIQTILGGLAAIFLRDAVRKSAN